MKRVIAIILSSLSVVFLVGAFVVQYFAARKLGMVRWLNYNGRKLESVIPLDIVFYVALALVIALAVFVIWRMWNRRDHVRIPLIVGTVFMVVVTAALVATVFFVKYDVTPAYFLIIPLIGLSASFQGFGLLVATAR